MDFNAAFDWRLSPDYRISFSGDYVKNIGYEEDEVNQRLGLAIDPRTEGYQVESAFGSSNMAKAAAWRVLLAYRYLERDAVLDAFTDSDFRLGGTDVKGFVVGGEYSLTPRVLLRARYFSRQRDRWPAARHRRIPARSQFDVLKERPCKSMHGCFSCWRWRCSRWRTTGPRRRRRRAVRAATRRRCSSCNSSRPSAPNYWPTTRSCKSDLDATRKERDALKKKQEASERRLKGTDVAVARATARSDSLSQELEREKARMAEIVAKFRELAGQLREVESERSTVKTALAQRDIELKQCVDRNCRCTRSMARFSPGSSIRGGFSAGSALEPFTRAQAHRTREPDRRLPDARRRAAAAVGGVADGCQHTDAVHRSVTIASPRACNLTRHEKSKNAANCRGLPCH